MLQSTALIFLNDNTPCRPIFNSFTEAGYMIRAGRAFRNEATKFLGEKCSLNPAENKKEIFEPAVE